MRGDFSSQERRIRTPVKGLRQKLRNALRAAGVTEKFRTDHGRHFMGYQTFGDGSPSDFLIVITRTYFKLPFETFEGKLVVIMVRRGELRS